MAVPQSQLVDLLYKKLFGVSKTDTSTNKSPSNEVIASPALNRGDTIWIESDLIPPVATPTANVVQSLVIQCLSDTTSVPVNGVYSTWKTNKINWIPSEFGSTYFVKVYAGASGLSDPTTGTQLFDSGANGVGEWYFDYQSGVLNFIGGTMPPSLTGSSVIYVVGYQYIGKIGVKNLALASNTTTTTTTITSNVAQGFTQVSTPTGSFLASANNTTLNVYGTQGVSVVANSKGIVISASGSLPIDWGYVSDSAFSSMIDLGSF
jgi:hypothetical protein